ncbi:MAG: hypothetical protein U0X20_15655 [Caldilineaceae bacterium]
MRVNKWLVPILALVLILGTVGIAQATGLWVVSGREMVDLAQLKSGDEVKGWMTLQQVADGMGMETAVLVAKLGLPAELPPETVLKDIEGIVEGFEITAVRTVVDEALGLAPAAEAGTTADGGEEAAAQEAPDAGAEAVASPLPTATAEPAAEPTAKPTAEPMATAAHEPTGTGTGTGDGEDQPAVTSAASIKGSHTLQQIVDGTGVDLGALLTALELPAGTNPQTTVRELVQGGQLTEVDQVRTAVAMLQ